MNTILNFLIRRRAVLTHTQFKPHQIAIAIASLCTVGSVQAADITFGSKSPGVGSGQHYQLGDASLTLQGALMVGTILRETSPNPALIGTLNSTANNDDGNQNYKQGDAVSTALNGYLKADLHYANVGLVVSTKAWYDEALKENNVPHGNSPNRYIPNTPLSDAGFAPGARFANVVLDEAYVYGKFEIDGHALDARLGNTDIPWVTPGTIGGGIQQVNSSDNAARGRAGAIPEDMNIPMPAFYLKLALSSAWDVDGFYQMKFKPNVAPGCGTYFSANDYLAPGCDVLTLNGSILSALTHKPTTTTDQQALGNPLDHSVRSEDHIPDNGQFGFSTHYLVDGLGTFGIYYANYTSRSPIAGSYRVGPGAVTPAAANTGKAVPTGVAVDYFSNYPTGIQMFGLNFKTKLADQTGIYSELTYRPNQPIAYNSQDFLAGVLTGKGPLGYLLNQPVGTSTGGYDRFAVSQLNLGISHPFGQLLGGNVSVAGEIGVKHVAGLPDVYDMRYGRQGGGMAPSAATPTCTRSSVTCSLSGFVTPWSSGARVRVEDKFAPVLDGLELSSALSFGADIKGYSNDTVFIQGRRLASFNLMAVYRQRYVFSTEYVRDWGGTYNIGSDRGALSMTAGVKF